MKRKLLQWHFVKKKKNDQVAFGERHIIKILIQQTFYLSHNVEKKNLRLFDISPGKKKIIKKKTNEQK